MTKKKTQPEILPDVEMCRRGVLSCNCCAKKGIGKKKIEREVNRLYPLNIASKWVIADKEMCTEQGIRQPVQCDHHTDREHYLLIY